jgi:hypothetical protein
MGATVTEGRSQRVSSCGMVANPVEIAPYQVSGLPRVIITSASLVPNAWGKILIDDSVVNVTKTWLIVSLQTVFSEQRFLSCSYYSIKCG